MDNRPDPVTAQAALDFVLWLNGAMDVLSDTPPDQAQWDKIRGKVGEQIAAIVAQRIRKAAEPLVSTAAQSGLTSGKSYSVSSAQQAIYRSQDALEKLEAAAADAVAYQSKLLGKSAVLAVVDDPYSEHGYVEYTKG